MRWKVGMRWPPIENHDGTYSIPLGGGLFSLIDAGDLEKISHCCWHASRCVGSLTYYAKGRAIGGSVAFGMHRVILSFPVMMIDHINGNGLDNRRCNLRLVTARQNNLNRRNRDRTSAFRGVSQEGSRWVSQIKFNYQLIRLGIYDSESCAAAAYDFAAKMLNGDFAVLNGVAAQIDIRHSVLSALRRRNLEVAE